MKKPIARFKKKNTAQVPLVMLTAYDYPGGAIASSAGVDIVLVGDSVGSNVLGYASIAQVTMADMIHHVSAVARGINGPFLLADLPYNSYETPKQAIKNAKELIAAGAQGVKMEGGREVIPQTQAVVDFGIPVCSHIGFTPQSCKTPGVCGKTKDQALDLYDAACALEKAGAFMIVLELIPQELAELITQAISIPTIGIGAGAACDGQVQVFHDAMGLSPKVFRHAHAFANGRDIFTKAIAQYAAEVRKKSFPSKSNAASMPSEVFAQVKDLLKKKKGD